MFQAPILREFSVGTDLQVYAACSGNTTQGEIAIHMRNKQKGFSLIELLIVVAIILIIAAMAILT